MTLPLVILAFFSIIAGFVQLPPFMGHFTPFANFMDRVLPVLKAVPENAVLDSIFGIIVIAVSLLGIYIAYVFYLRRPELVQNYSNSTTGSRINRFLFLGWQFDWLYDCLFVQPFLWLARVNKNDFVDLIFTGLARLNREFHYLFSGTQTGKVRFYAAGIALGAVITVAIVVFA